MSTNPSVSLEPLEAQLITKMLTNLQANLSKGFPLTPYQISTLDHLLMATERISPLSDTVDRATLDTIKRKLDLYSGLVSGRIKTQAIGAKKSSPLQAKSSIKH